MAAATNPTPPSDPDKWKAALRACRFNNITQSYIGSHGILTANNFAAILYSQMDLFFYSINKPSSSPAPPEGSTKTVMLSYSLVVKLKGLRAYLDYLKARGQALNPDTYVTTAQIAKWVGRMDDLARFSKIREKNRPTYQTS
jgi:hypothetical protein